MFFIIIGVIAGIFIEQTHPLPNLRKLFKCSKKYGEPNEPDEDQPEPPEPPEHNDTDIDFDTNENETTHTDWRFKTI